MKEVRSRGKEQQTRAGACGRGEVAAHRWVRAARREGPSGVRRRLCVHDVRENLQFRAHCVHGIIDEGTIGHGLHEEPMASDIRPHALRAWGLRLGRALELCRRHLILGGMPRGLAAYRSSGSLARLVREGRSEVAVRLSEADFGLQPVEGTGASMLSLPLYAAFCIDGSIGEIGT